jgi:signal transduction histidine kinase
MKNRIKRELASQPAVADSVLADLDKVLGDVQKVLALVKDLKRDLHALDEGQAMSREPARLRVRDMVEQTISEYPNRPAHVQVQIAIDEDVAMVRAVLREVADILRNLDTNAIEAMPKGGTITWHAKNVGQADTTTGAQHW